MAAMAGYVGLYEGSGWNVAYVLSAILAGTAFFLLLTRRLLVASVISAALLSIVLAASAVKLQLMHMALHAYDVVFYLTSAATLVFLVETYPLQMVGLFGAFGLLAFAWWRLHITDGTRIPRLYSAVLLAGLVGFSSYAAARKDVLYAFQQFEGGFTVTKFLNSWRETLDTMARGQLFEAATKANAPPFPPAAACTPAEKPPHILLIHEESVVPPEFFPSLPYDRTMDRMFRSFDGKLHPLRVETFAGGSWLTEFSMLTGLSTYAFGSMRPFVQSLMAGKISDTMPQRLAACGYRNTVFYPLHRNFVSNARLYTAVGMPEIFDIKDQKAPSANERDAFYFNNVLDLVETHTKTSDKPLFSFIITMAAHQPYHSTFAPEMAVPGGDAKADGPMHEYLRRLSLARIDLEDFKAKLKSRFPTERFVLVHYGDHQPTVTWNYLSEADHQAIRSEDRARAATSKAYLTYFAVEGINYEPAALPAVDVMDVPYLSVAVLKAARIPLSPAFEERDRLLLQCKGRYNACEPSVEILSFHKRLIDSGLVMPR